jgi:hypothetical protein
LRDGGIVPVQVAYGEKALRDNYKAPGERLKQLNVVDLLFLNKRAILSTNQER